MRRGVGSSGEIWTLIRPPGPIRMRSRRIFPAVYAISSWPLSRETRNMPPPSASSTSPSTSTFSSRAIRFLLLDGARPGRAARRSYGSSDGLDVDGLGALLPLARLELDTCVLAQRLEAAARDVRVVDEKILAPLVRRDEAVALRVVEPLHGSGCHM